MEFFPAPAVILSVVLLISVYAQRLYNYEVNCLEGQARPGAQDYFTLMLSSAASSRKPSLAPRRAVSTTAALKSSRPAHSCRMRVKPASASAGEAARPSSSPPVHSTMRSLGRRDRKSTRL